MEKTGTKITGKTILQDLEKHCNEELKCSKRLRFLIEQRFNRVIDAHETLKGNIYQLATGESNAVYNSKTHKPHANRK